MWDVFCIKKKDGEVNNYFRYFMYDLCKSFIVSYDFYVIVLFIILEYILI